MATDLNKWVNQIHQGDSFDLVHLSTRTLCHLQGAI